MFTPFYPELNDKTNKEKFRIFLEAKNKISVLYLTDEK